MCHAARRRPQAARAIPLLPRQHGRRLCLGQDLLGLGQGRRDAGEPHEAGVGQLVQILGAIEGTVGHEIGRAGSGMERRHMVTDDLAKHCAIMTMATQGLPQPRETRLVLHDQLQHDLVEVGAMVPTIAWSDVHDLFVRRLIAVRAAIDMATRRIEMAERGRQPQSPRRRGSNEAVEGRHPSLVQRIESAPERVIIAMAGLNAWGNEAREGFILEKMGHEVELVVEKTETVEPHSFDCMASGHNAHCRVLLRRLVNDLGDAEFFKYACDKAKVIEDQRAVWWRLRRDGRTVRVSHSFLLCRGDCIDTPKLLNYM